MKNWIVKSKGKLFLFIILIIIPIVVLFVFDLRVTYKYGGELIDNFLSSLGVFSLLILAWYATIPRMLINKKVPKKISVDTDSKRLFIEISRKKKYDFKKHELAYSFKEYNMYSVLVIYQKILSIRGHYVYQEFIDIIGTNLFLGWKKRDLNEIVVLFKELNYESHNDEHIGLLTRLLK